MKRGIRNQPPAPRVLVVDDHDDLRESIVLLLENEGFVVDGAANASQALRAARQAAPSVAIVDLGMPVVDGWDLIRVLRSESRGSRGHIIAMSGFDDGPSRARAFAAGCDQYVVKEGGVAQLVSAVQTYCVRAFS